MNKQRYIILFFTSLLTFLKAKEALFMSFMLNQSIDDNREWFLITADQIYANTGLSRAQQSAIKKRLYDLEILETERRGSPPKNWYNINWCKLSQYVPDVEDLEEIL
jgi:hypothetical protein